MGHEVPSFKEVKEASELRVSIYLVLGAGVEQEPPCALSPTGGESRAASASGAATGLRARGVLIERS
eukprot:scaffold10113_cov150-Isochrysis_galbana.AAC.2